ncbi:hypothetical protein [Enterobacter hormaechei]|uniref:hypothetical protein n=1 Tax=Enterobacter hormaechei TaxID=158836 RepID=UPI0026EE8786|nr:hypothetical protein [Enterobacter hormaechei]
MMTTYFYIPGSFSAREQAELIAGAYQGKDSGQTFSELKAEYPSIKVLTLGECIAAIREAAKLPVTAISQVTYELFKKTQIFDEAHSGIGSTFKVREFHAADIVTCFAMVVINRETHYFTFRDMETIDHDQILEAVHSAKPDTYSLQTDTSFV